MIKDLTGLGLSYMHKLSVLRLAVDLIKADNQIFGEEVAVLAQLQALFGLTQRDVDGIHYITLQQAIEALKDLDEHTDSMIAKAENPMQHPSHLRVYPLLPQEGKAQHRHDKNA